MTHTNQAFEQQTVSVLIQGVCDMPTVHVEGDRVHVFFRDNDERRAPAIRTDIVPLEIAKIQSDGGAVIVAQRATASCPRSD